MRIAIFTDTFLPTVDGVVSATLNLSKGLADRGHKVYIIAPKSGKKEVFSYKNIIVKRVSSVKAFFYKDYSFTSIFNLEIFNYLKKEKIDLIHFQTPISLGMEAILISKLLKVPLVGTFHTFFMDPQYLEHIKVNNRFVQGVSWTYARFYYNQCDLITCPSESTRKELLSHDFNQPLEVISNGIDFGIFKNPDWKKVRKKFLKKMNYLLLFVGRIAHGKNINYLLDCFKLVVKKVPDAVLLIVGDGPQMDEVKQKIKKLNLEKNIIFTGKIPHEDLVKSSIYKACDLFVTASTTENQPMTVLEAQVNGLPCVGISERGVKDLVKNGYNGFLARDGNKKEFADKIVKILLDKKLRKKMRENTIKEIEKHKLSKVISVWEKEYSKLIKNHNLS
jgi:glycosyltransferase involved in cell wall biosynthesis